MSVEGKGTRGLSIWNTFQRVAVAIAVVASVATLVGVLVQVRSNDPVIEVRTLSAERLTIQAELPGFQSEIQYGDRRLSDLWKIRVRLTNPGPVVLLTAGPRQNVLGDGLTLSVQGGQEILEVVPEASDFPQTTTLDSIGAIAITFTQWRVTEAVEYSVYVTSSSPMETAPQLVMSDRDLVDGEIERVSLEGNEPAGSLLFAQPPPFAMTGRILGGILSAIGVITAPWALLAGTWELVRIKNWYRTTGVAFQKFLEDPDTELPERYAHIDIFANPWMLGDLHWERFLGPRYPDEAPTVETFGAWVVWVVVWSVLGAACLALLAAVLPPL